MNNSAITPSGAFGAIAVTLLIGTELSSTAGVFVWAISGMLNLPKTTSAVLAGIIGIPSLIVLAKIAVMAFKSEMGLASAVDGSVPEPD